MNLAERIKRVAEFDYSNSRIAYQKHEWPMNETISQHTYWTHGQDAENARLQSLIEKLAAVAGAIDGSGLSCEAMDALYALLEQLEKERE